MHFASDFSTFNGLLQSPKKSLFCNNYPGQLLITKKNTTMEKKSKAPIIYGYAVCIIAVITFIISTASLVNAILDMGDPLHASSWYGSNQPSLASFENYKMDILKSPETELQYVPDDTTLHSMYEAAKNDRIQAAKHNANKSLIVNSILIIISILLFTIHWIWMRRLNIKSSSS